MASRTGHATGDDRIPQPVSDITDSRQLLSYALAGQLERLKLHRAGISQAKIAEAARLSNNARNSAPALSRALREGPGPEQLAKLDEILGALVPDLARTGGLVSLGLRLSAQGRGRDIAARVPPSWAGQIVLKDHRPCSELDVLAQASALLTEFAAAERVDARSVIEINDRYASEMELLARRLILIAVSPPTPRNYDAQILLGNLAGYAFEPMRDWLDTAVRYSPLAFRVWRAITKLVKLRADGEHVEELMVWVQQLLSDAAELRKRSLYPGRSLDLELAMVVPASSSPASNDWVGDALRLRARDNDATVRERGTAAMGLWQRALEQGRSQDAEEDLRPLIAEFEDPDTRPDAAAGLRWVAACMRQVIDSKEAVCNEWPDLDEPWLRHVHQAAEVAGRFVIHDHLRAGTMNLFRHMILQNAGVYRRHAIETVVTSGMAAPVARALGHLLHSERTEAWLRIRAEFALGFLQQANRVAEDDLTHACLDAHANLALADSSRKPSRSSVTEMHASLFAVGDCFGVAGAEERARSARERLRPVLTELASIEGSRAIDLRRAARATAYLLTMTAQPSSGGEPDLSQVLLEKMRNHPDGVTARLSRWALSFRFTPEGQVRPLLDAAEYGIIEDSPY